MPIIFLLHGSEPLGKLLVSLKDLPELLVSWDGLRMLSVKEIGAKKACTIGRRGTYKDYVDLYFVVAEHHASLADIISMAEQSSAASLTRGSSPSNCFSWMTFGTTKSIF